MLPWRYGSNRMNHPKECGHGIITINKNRMADDHRSPYQKVEKLFLHCPSPYQTKCFKRHAGIFRCCILISPIIRSEHVRITGQSDKWELSDYKKMGINSSWYTEPGTTHPAAFHIVVLFKAEQASKEKLEAMLSGSTFMQVAKFIITDHGYKVSPIDGLVNVPHGWEILSHSLVPQIMGNLDAPWIIRIIHKPKMFWETRRESNVAMEKSTLNGCFNVKIGKNVPCLIPRGYIPLISHSTTIEKPWNHDHIPIQIPSQWRPHPVLTTFAQPRQFPALPIQYLSAMGRYSDQSGFRMV